MTNQNAMAKVIRYLYKNPGTYTPSSLAEVMGVHASTASRALSAFGEMNPNHYRRLNKMTHVILPFETRPEPEPEPEVRREPELSQQALRFRSVSREDEFPSEDFFDYGYPPPFRVKVYDHRNRENGLTYYARDEHGKRWWMKEMPDD